MRRECEAIRGVCSKQDERPSSAELAFATSFLGHCMLWTCTIVFETMRFVCRKPLQLAAGLAARRAVPLLAGAPRSRSVFWRETASVDVRAASTAGAAAATEEVPRATAAKAPKQKQQKQQQQRQVGSMAHC